LWVCVDTGGFVVVLEVLVLAVGVELLLVCGWRGCEGGGASGLHKLVWAVYGGGGGSLDK